MHQYKTIRHHFEDDLLSRVPGEHASIDAMYRITGRTRSPDEAAITFVMGEDHQVCRWYVLDADSDAAIYPGLKAFAKKLQTQTYFNRKLKKNENALTALKYWHSDTCCHGANDITTHPLMSLFPSMTRPPYLDGFHGVNRIAETLQNPVERAVVTRRFGDIVRRPNSPDLEEVVQYLGKRKINPITDRDAAKRHALANHRESIRSVGRDGNVLSSELLQQGLVFEQIRVEWAASQLPGRLPSFRAPGISGQPSTFDVVQNLATCAKKGCLSDCRPFEDCYRLLYTRPKTGLPVFSKKSESGKNETFHRLVNLIVAEVASLSPELAHARIDIRIFRYNIENDIRIGLRSPDNHLPFWLLKSIKSRAESSLEGAAEMYPGILFPESSSQPETQGFKYQEEFQRLKLHDQLKSSVSLRSEHPLPASLTNSLIMPTATATVDRDRPPVNSSSHFVSSDVFVSGDVLPLSLSATPTLVADATPSPSPAHAKRSSLKVKKVTALDISKVSQRKPNNESDVRLLYSIIADVQSSGIPKAQHNDAVARNYNIAFNASFLTNPTQPIPSAPISKNILTKYLNDRAKLGFNQSFDAAVPRSVIIIPQAAAVEHPLRLTEVTTDQASGPDPLPLIISTPGAVDTTQLITGTRDELSDGAGPQSMKRKYNPEKAAERSKRQKDLAAAKAQTESLTFEAVSTLSAESMLAYLKLIKTVDHTIKIHSSKSEREAELHRFLARGGGIFVPHK